MTTGHRRQRRVHRCRTSAHRGSGPVVALICGSALLLGGCADDDEAAQGPADAGETVTTQAEAAATSDESDRDGGSDTAADAAEPAPAPGTAASIPGNMPEGVPLPDEYVVLRATSLTGEDDTEFGEHVSVNIAIGGTVDEQRAFYAAELRAAYGELEFEDGIAGESVRFRGEWFEDGRVFVTENNGELDNAQLDTSHLPVMLTVQVWERDSS